MIKLIVLGLVWLNFPKISAQVVDQMIACDSPIINYSGQQFARTMHFNIPPGQVGEKVFHWYANNRRISDYAKIYIDGVLVKTLWVGDFSSSDDDIDCQLFGAGETANTCRRGPVKYTYNADGTDSIENLHDQLQTLDPQQSEQLFEDYFNQGDNSAIMVYTGAWRILGFEHLPFVRTGAYHLEIHVPAETCQIKITVGDTVSSSVWSGDLQCPKLDCENRYEEIQGCGVQSSLSQIQCIEFHQLSSVWRDSNEEILPNGISDITDSGIYFVDRFFDGGNCTHRTRQTISLLEALVQTTPASCENASDGTANMIATNGIGSLDYQWSSGEQTNTVEGLVGGENYQATVTDELGCSANIALTVPFLSPPQVAGNVFNVGCYGEATGGIDLSIQGEHENYRSLWSNGESGVSLVDLTAGVYTANISYGQGCVETHSFTVSAPPILDFEIDSTTLAACGEGNGTMGVSITGGTPGYNLSIPGEVVTPIYEGFYEVPVGEHQVVITDANGCVATGEVEIEMGQLQAEILYEVRGCEQLFTATIVNEYGESIGEQVDLGHLGLNHHSIGQTVDFDYRGCPMSAVVRRKDGSQYHPRSYRINRDRSADSHPNTLDIYLPNIFQRTDPDIENRYFGFFLPDNQPEITVPAMRVFDRWGGMQFENLNFKMKNPFVDNQQAWNGMTGGKVAETGVYAYYIDFGCGVVVKGDVTFLE